MKSKDSNDAGIKVRKSPGKIDFIVLTLLTFFFPLFIMPLFGYGVDEIIPLMVLFSGIYMTLLVLVFVIGNPP